MIIPENAKYVYKTTMTAWKKLVKEQHSDANIVKVNADYYEAYDKDGNLIGDYNNSAFVKMGWYL